MTKEQIDEILRILGLDEWRASESLYVFYRTGDGLVHNFALGVRRGRTMSDDEVVALMRREYPSTRDGEVLAVDRPDSAAYHAKAHETWLGIPEACRLLKIDRSTLHRWTERGIFKASRVGSRVYYSREEIDRILRENIIGENGRIDRTGAATS